MYGVEFFARKTEACRGNGIKHIEYFEVKLRWQVVLLPRYTLVAFLDLTGRWCALDLVEDVMIVWASFSSGVDSSSVK